MRSRTMRSGCSLRARFNPDTPSAASSTPYPSISRLLRKPNARSSLSSMTRIRASGAAGTLTVRGATPPSHRERRGARLARRDDREYREYLREEQRSQPGCIAARMQKELHHGLLSRFLDAELPHLRVVEHA